MPDEAELLYVALRSEWGIVVRCDPTRLRSTRAKLLAKDPALRDLQILGPDAKGQLWILRALKVNEALKEKDHE